MKNLIKRYTNIHIPGSQPDIFVFATPRGGSTWVMELICSQKGFRYCSEPLDLRSADVRKCLKMDHWEELYSSGSSDKFKRYFDGIKSGSISFRNPNPLRRHYRLFTNRMVYKVIHGGVDKISWFRETFQSRILLVLRHPIPVSQSRKEFPFLMKFFRSEYQRQFTTRQRSLVKHVLERGSHLECGVVAWCLHNSIPLRDIEEEMAIVTYEQIVLQPTPVIEFLCERLLLTDPDRIYKQLNVPSRSTVLSDSATRKNLSDGAGARPRQWLVEKWKSRISAEEKEKVQDILDVFEFSVYSADCILPTKDIWIGDQASLLEKDESRTTTESSPNKDP